MKIFPIASNNFQTKNVKKVSFSSNPSAVQNKPLDILVLRAPENSDLPWIKDQNLLQAVNYLSSLEFDKNDIKYVQSMGVVLPFLKGKDAVNFIIKNRVGVKFAQLPSEKIHAQYDYDDNCIKINDKYKDTQNLAEILAISEAILHEAGHAKDQDDETTIQEEIDCLSMNALSHRILDKKHHDIFTASDSPIIKDGVCIYSKLFFDEDPLKLALVRRLGIKYGDLPAGDLRHSPSAIAIRVKELQN